MQTAIVTTTIYVPKLLESYAADAKKHGRDVIFIVIGDKKTPAETEKFCASLQKKSGFKVEYFSPAQQDTYLARFPALKKHLVWNSIQRRNVGLLFAYESECETIITIDDDNFRVTNDFVGAHDCAVPKHCEVVSTTTGWMNICTLLNEKHGRTFYHRGFPLEKRAPTEKWKRTKKKVRPVVNAGLWLGDPDVDAMERLNYLADPTEATSYTGKTPLAPAKGTWTPFNSQNTALRRDAIPGYFLSPLIGRYDDIWAAYVLKHIADHLDDSIVFGTPLVRQERNPHNYWRDLDNERYGHALTLRFVEALATIKLKGKTYRACYSELATKLPKALAKRTDIRTEEKPFLGGYFEGMQVWVETFRRIS